MRDIHTYILTQVCLDLPWDSQDEQAVKWCVFPGYAGYQMVCVQFTSLSTLIWTRIVSTETNSSELPGLCHIPQLDNLMISQVFKTNFLIIYMKANSIFCFGVILLIRQFTNGLLKRKQIICCSVLGIYKYYSTIYVIICILELVA